MNVPQTHLLEYLGAEETNLLVSMNLCKRDMDFFPKLDGLFQEPLKYIDLKIKNRAALTHDDKHRMAVLTLYLYVHYHLYSAFSTMLRCHLSDALSQSRKAIDAAFTAARLIREPATLTDYFDRHRDYRNIKRTVSDANKKQETEYPDTGPLVEMHEICSQFGSHADVSSLIHRVEITEPNELGKSLMRLLMFQKPDSELEFRYYLVQILVSFAQMLWLFRNFVGDIAAGIEKDKWITTIGQTVLAIQKESEQIAAAMKEPA